MPSPKHSPYRPVVLAILDGFGENPDSSDNAVALANTPNIDALKSQFPHTFLNTSGLAVGLPEGQMGNSEVGHMNIGSGRVVMQDLPRIDAAIADGSLANNPKLLEFVEKLKASGGVCHIMGLLSDGGVHSHQNHIAGLAKIISASGIKVLIHAFTDGRDTPPQSALQYIADFKKEFPQAQFASVSGRYYAMDRDKRWDRVSMACDNMALASGKNYPNIEAAVQQSYQDGKNDEFVLPASIGDYAGMQDGDGLIMANFRADRAREILEVMLKPDFSGFGRKKIVNFAAAIGTSEYSTDLNNYIETLFAPEELKNILAEVLANNNKTQLHISETEKYAHVTFFFNGGKEENYPGEERILIPSPGVATYDLQPEMSAFIVTDKLVEAIENDKFDFIVVNFANCDMVGHTGDLQAASKAVEAVDQSVGRLWQAVQAKAGVLLITADHGNAEQMYDHDTKQPHTAHTLNLVPFIVAAKDFAGKKLNVEQGKLADIAPTILNLMQIAKPAEMSGNTINIL